MSADFADFQWVEVGKQGTTPTTLATENYDVASGSTVVTLKNSYLKTLPAGTYTLNIVSATGTASTTFTITGGSSGATDSSNNPQTGDNSNTILWVALLLLSGSTLTAFGVSKKRKKANNK